MKRLLSTSQTEQIRQLVQCGDTMYAVGTFTAVQKGSTSYTRSRLMARKLSPGVT